MGDLKPGSLARNEPLPSPVRGLSHALSRGIPVSLWPHRLLARRPQRHVSQSDPQASAGFVGQSLPFERSGTDWSLCAWTQDEVVAVVMLLTNEHTFRFRGFSHHRAFFQAVQKV